MARMTEAFYLSDGGDFVASVHTRGPWSARHQHGGPPAALLARAIEAAAPGFVVVRITAPFTEDLLLDPSSVSPS